MKSLYTAMCMVFFGIAAVGYAIPERGDLIMVGTMTPEQLYEQNRELIESSTKVLRQLCDLTNSDAEFKECNEKADQFQREQMRELEKNVDRLKEYRRLQQLCDQTKSGAELKKCHEQMEIFKRKYLQEIEKSFEEERSTFNK